MPSLSATGNFIARPNIYTAVGSGVSYHFHNFDHTALPLAGLWKVTQYTYTEGEIEPNPANAVDEILIGSKLFTPPDTIVQPWALVVKRMWHRIELVSKRVYPTTCSVNGEEVDVNNVLIEMDNAEFWCCFSIRDYTGEVVEFNTGWNRAFQ
jgi:hypothetical protein